MKILSLGFLAIAVAIGYRLREFSTSLGYEKELVYSDHSCKFLDFPTPLEDLTQLGDGHSVFAGAGDLGNLFASGSAHAESGVVWLINTTSESIEKMQVTGSAVPSKLILHGLYFSQTSNTLYAVNHDTEIGESVEVFDVIREGSNLHLNHRVSIRSPLFQNYALNDVVEGVPDEQEFYVTEWLPFGLPPGGKEAESGHKKLASVAINILKIRLTRVFRCSLKAPSPRTCTIASTTRFVGANGIAVSSDRQTFFVNDPASTAITVMGRQPDGTLTASSQIRTKHNLDNIEMTSDGKLSGGAIHLLYTCRSVCEDAKFLSRTKVVGGREVGCSKSPGGHLTISLLGTGGSSYVEGTQVDGLIHDGSKLRGIASALQLSNNKTILGSYHQPGLLVCDAFQ